MSTWIGKTLGKVYIDSLIARGGMAVVYLGMHTTLQRKVVVKILRNDFEDDAASIERFEREAQVVAKLRHPHIVQVFDFDTVDDQPYIVMEYIAGPSLSKYLNTLHGKIGRLEAPQVGRVLDKVATALQYAHDSGVIHRDVKPANILLTSRSSQIVPDEPLPLDFEPILTDFGLVRFLSSSLQTSSGQIVGTPAYMSPEQARGEHTDERTDIYSLGIVLYEMLAGHVPFDGETTMSILLKHINEPPPPIPGLAFGFQYVLDRALAKKPEDRFQTPQELAAAFNEVLEETSGASTIVPLSPRSTQRARKMNVREQPRGKWLLAALATVLIAAVGAFFFLNGRALPSPESPTPSVSSTIEINTPASLISSPVHLGPTGLLRFQDGNAIMDQVNLTALAMPGPPHGSQYEVSLVNSDGEERLNLGVLSLGENGQGTLTFNDDQKRNLLSLYDSVEIIIRPTTESDATSRVAYFYALPTAGLQYVRQLLVSFSIVPQQVALIQGLSVNTQLIDRAAEEMLSAYENGNQAGVRENAEAIMNLLVGSKSQQHKDWNSDGQITDPGDGYGFLINVDNLGYIQAIYSHADYAANSPGASQNMIVNGENIKICAQNLAQWAAQLRDQALIILTSDSSDLGQPVRESASIADHVLNGMDLDNDGEVEPTANECGVLTTYEHAYRMADMPLLPVNLIATPTPTPTFSIFAVPTKTSERRPDATSPNITVPNTSPPNTSPPNTAVPPPANTPSGPRACSDGIDNDGDGNTDFPADPDCRNNGDNSE
ncbi:MAG: protein kinase [Chloroflexota bacterium]|nr:protein kinase [Chloroflexota bacterium]